MNDWEKRFKEHPAHEVLADAKSKAVVKECDESSVEHANQVTRVAQVLDFVGGALDAADPNFIAPGQLEEIRKHLEPARNDLAAYASDGGTLNHLVAANGKLDQLLPQTHLIQSCSTGEPAVRAIVDSATDFREKSLSTLVSLENKVGAATAKLTDLENKVTDAEAHIASERSKFAATLGEIQNKFTEDQNARSTEIGQGILELQDRWRHPFLVSFPLSGVVKGAVPDSAIAAQRTRSGAMRRVERDIGRVQRGRVSDTVLSEGELAFVEDVLSHPQDGVKQRYKRLRWSAHSGTRIKRRLLNQGILEASTVTVGRTRKQLLGVTAKARREQGLNPEDARRESLPHAYWKAYYAQLYREQKWDVQLEAQRPNDQPGNCDVLAIHGTKRVAIEVETGKSNAVSNVRRDLLAGVDEVLVVATDANAFERVERELAAAGLLVASRVRVVLRD